MGVLIMTNAASGRGRAARLGEAIAGALGASGQTPEVRDARACARDHGGPARFAGFDAVVVVGGDGTLHYLLPDLAASLTPVYHVPAGTENLFAREFGMTPDAEALQAALRQKRVRQVDLASADDRCFVLMASVGPDAGVIHRLHAARSRAAGHLMYVRPVLQEFVRPHLPRVRVVVDGEPVVDGRRGVVVVANSRQYARRLNPACEADMSDGLLDVVFLPAHSSASVLAWGGRCARRAQFIGGRAVFVRGREVEVTSHQRAPWQCDGEAGGWLGPGDPLRLAVQPGALRVLCP
jgi:diacylglycerol kinase (ATP)